MTASLLVVVSTWSGHILIRSIPRVREPFHSTKQSNYLEQQNWCGRLEASDNHGSWILREYYQIQPLPRVQDALANPITCWNIESLVQDIVIHGAINIKCIENAKLN